jgi:galactokinase/mevalonate kinase-like predicted kinase
MDAVVIAKAPVCVPLGGDMGELAGLYERSGGPVICAATGYSVYAFLAPSHLDGVHLTFAGRHVLSGTLSGDGSKANAPLELLQSIVRRFGSFGSQQVFVASQFPQVGAMLQGSLAVATLKAIAFRCGLDLEPQALAQLACDTGSSAPGEGCADYVHFAAALGGLCALTRSSGKIIVEPLDVTPGVKRVLEERLMVFVTLNHDRGPPGVRALAGNHRSARRAAEPQLEPVKELVWAARSELERGDLDAFGRMLHRLWIARHAVVERDCVLGQGYEAALAAGALGGTATSGVDGACLVVYCAVERQGDVAEKLATYGFERWPLALEEEGVYALQGVPWSRSETGSPAAWLQPFASSPTLSAHGGQA